MFACLLVTIFVVSVSGDTEPLQSWVCSKTPSCSQSHLPFAPLPSDECKEDTDCPVGAYCCYKSCVRKCEFQNPCFQVICQEGYLCQSKGRPCNESQCHPEATCVPERQVRCSTPVCEKAECQPGFQRGNDTSGCPTCECIKKRDCGPNCLTLCAHGFEMKNGCPSCECKPEPKNPCSSLRCGQTEECRFVKVRCKQAPCPPVATCISIIKVKYANTCSLSDPTTVGLPVLDYSIASEVDCYVQPCPAYTICTRLGNEINRCCWQATQKLVVSPPKVGECPSQIPPAGLSQKCQVDESCPGDQKCCYRMAGQNSTQPSGYCVSPVRATP